jgi:hypothetical protein
MIVELVDLKKLKIPINKDQPVCCYSQAKQDLFVVAMTNGISNGTWLEIGCYLPEFINNTYMLEKDFEWSGYSIDIDSRLEQTWKITRPLASFIGTDALTLDWQILPSSFDYVQIDIDPVENNLKMLEIILDKIKFKTLTFEHDYFSATKEAIYVREQSRKLLIAAGYEMIANDVTILPSDGRPSNDNPMWFEDWWVDPQAIDQTVIQTYKNITQDIKPKYWDQILL